MKALQAAITLHTNSPEPNGEQLSRCYHSLVQLVMSREEAPQGVEGEGWGLFTQILDLLDSTVKVSVVRSGQVRWSGLDPRSVDGGKAGS